MFEKLLANLPYNPTLKHQVGFYVRSLRHEESVRRTGLILVSLAFAVQLIGFIGAPQTTKTYGAPAARNGATSPSGRSATGVVQRNSVANITAGQADAGRSSAQPNDVLTYTLFADNHSQSAVQGFVMQDDLQDVLDYTTVVDLYGGKLDQNGTVSWPADTIAANSTLTHKVTVRVKNPLPSGDAQPTDPRRFNYILTNVYGNQLDINLQLPPGLAQVVSVSSNDNLPQIGRTAGLLLTVVILVITGYFYARARLLVDESVKVMQETNAGRI